MLLILLYMGLFSIPAGLAILAGDLVKLPFKGGEYLATHVAPTVAS